MSFDSFIAKWSASSGAERANKDLFFTELCDLLEVPRPNPVTGDASLDRYVFEKDAPYRHADGKRTTRKVDVYREGAFLLEAKQGSDAASLKLGTARRETDAWNLAMQDALGQALGYARCFDAPPPFLVVADIGYCFDLYACFDKSQVWAPFPNAQQRRIHLRDLAAHAETLRAVFTDPGTLDPSRRAAKVTREVAAHLGELAAVLERTGQDQETVARFLMRCLFTMFAEDVGLLPPRLFTESIEKYWLPNPASFPGGVEHLWRTMNAGGDLLFGKILRFNGGLFRDATAVPLGREGLLLLHEAAKCDWGAVEPAIFGTLLERALHAKERHRLGAHYTPRAYVERLVRPTVEEPLRAEWDLCRAEVHRLVGRALDGEGRASKANRKKASKLIGDFHRRLAGLRVLDPACGSGNFLYVTLDLFMRIESEVLALLSELGETQELLEMQSVRVTPGQFLGIEVKPWAKEIAELVLWIGYLQWHFRAYAKTRPVPDPVLMDYGNVECRDAVLAYDGEVLVRDPVNGRPVTRWDGETMKTHPVTGLPVPDESAQVPVYEYENPRRAEWPAADFIVGNPPFIGGWRLRQLLGDGYVDAFRSSYPSLPEKADFVMAWWLRAAEAVGAGRVKRFGLITTNSITQHFAQRVVAPIVNDAAGPKLVFAIADHPWVDDTNAAAVRISMTVGALHTDTVSPRLAFVRDEDAELAKLDEREVERILPNLTAGVDVHSATALRANEDIASPGMQLFGAGFLITREQALALRAAAASDEARRSIRPFVNGRDIMAKTRDAFVIDFSGLGDEVARSLHPAAFQHVLDRVKPERDANKVAYLSSRWWLFGRERQGLRAATRGLSRYIVTPETAKHRVFSFLDASVLPDNMLTAVASSDAWVLGVLSSSVHIVWTLAAGSTLEDRPRSTKAVCFDPFPFPDPSPTQRARIAQLGEDLDAHRKRQQAAHPSLTMTGMYNVLAKLRAGEPLDAKDKKVHEEGLVSILRRIHDELDAAVLDAYGFPVDLDEAGILERLVALNQQRAAEEARGLVRWLRPEFQAPKTAAAALPLPAAATQSKPRRAGKGTQAAKPDEAPTSARVAWPKALPEQLATVRAALPTLPQPFARADLAGRFAAAPAADLDAALGCLAALGLVLRLGDDAGAERYGAVELGRPVSSRPVPLPEPS